MKRIEKMVMTICCVALLFITTGSIAFERSAAKDLIILFTHDLHSYFLPHRILTQEGKQMQQGGYAKLAYLINEQRIKHQNKTLRVDAGDFSMGTLFHTSYLKEASELRLLGKMGYDVVTFGNHDFDFHADGLARMLQAAQDKSKQLPALVASNVIFSKNDPGDAALRQEFKKYPVKEYTVIERNGIRIGIFGIMGNDAADDTPFAKPVKFADPIRTAKRIAGILQDKEKVDMIICLSHSGTSPVKSKSEDEILAKKVPEIDVIISGHTHTVLPQPIIIGKTIIVSSGCYSEYLGILGVSYAKGKGVKLVSYNLKNITVGIPDDKIIADEIAKYKRIVERDFLAAYHLSFDQVIAQSDYNMESLASAYANPREMGLGNMITDSFRYAVQKTEGKNHEYINFALEPLGLIRDSLQKGKITVADVFQVLSLGLGMDGVAGYPLVAFYINGKELKDVLEVETSVALLIKEDAHLQISGVKFVYNPHRILLDRVTKVLVQEEDGEYRPLNPQKLYRICLNRYAAEMVNYVVKVTYGLIDVQPKDKNGKALKDLKEAIVYLDGKSPQSGELKEWIALTQFTSSFKDTNLPQKYNGPEGRYRAEPSWNPIRLIAAGNAITYGALILGFLLVCLIGLVVWYVVRRITLLRQSR
jgi:2',3'-cyclic-nucleotide 2'-phosphodiesterase (5'-nucleotidase family)